MLHSGGAYGGHYSAYIQDFEATNAYSWYHFNDSFVKKIDMTDLVDAFGFSDTPKNRRLAANHQNAYMLLYRLIKDNKQPTIFTLDHIHEEVLQEVKAANENK